MPPTGLLINICRRSVCVQNSRFSLIQLTGRSHSQFENLRLIYQRKAILSRNLTTFPGELPLETLQSPDMSKSNTKPIPSTPRPSASLIIINSQNEVLLVQRNPDSRSFAGMHVFPGGNYDPKQDLSLKMTAIRETFEETGVLLAHPSLTSYKFKEKRDIPPLSEEELDKARKYIHAEMTTFPAFLEEYGLEPDTDSLMPFTQWITPPPVPRRFHTRFYVAFLPSKESTTITSTISSPSINDEASTSHHHHRLPTPDGTHEIISTIFLHPSKALSLFNENNQISLMPPQFYILSTLADIIGSSSRNNTEQQRESIAKLSKGAFGRMIINPRAIVGEEQGIKEGKRTLTYEGDETRGGKKGRLHRSLVKFDRRGIPLEIELIRNFDIFNDIEEHLFPEDRNNSSTSASPGISKL